MRPTSDLVVHFLAANGGILTTVSVKDAPGVVFPTLPNNGVGLLTLSIGAEMPPVRGQAGLPLQYAHSMCATGIRGIAITLPTGTLTTSVQIQGSNFPGSSASVTVNPFQPAEAYGYPVTSPNA